jgi:hypothetical protein
MSPGRKKWIGPGRPFDVHGTKATGNVHGAKNSVLNETRERSAVDHEGESMQGGMYKKKLKPRKRTRNMKR